MAIDVVQYNPTWPAAFEEERRRLSRVLGPWAIRIDHHGSTAVPGLAAKPIIDIQISVVALDPLTPFIDALVPLGYVHVAHPDDERCPFLHRPSEWPHTHHLHFVRTGSGEEWATLAFRDYLRSHPDAAAEYGSLKRELATRHRGDTFASREAYAAAKSAFVAHVLSIARSP